MTDPPGVQPALGIEAVEWFPSRGERLTVRVTGRWLRRPPASRGQPMLVVSAEGQRHRFPAMPEPPSLGGTPPGAWSVSFSVPAWLAPYLSRRLSLQMGGVFVPLPGARAVTTEPDDRYAAEGHHQAQSDTEAAELATPHPKANVEPIAESNRDLAAGPSTTTGELDARVESLERELSEVRREPDKLREVLDEHERALRSAADQARSETAPRDELREELPARPRAEADAKLGLDELAATEARLRELERQLAELRRGGAEGPGITAAAGQARPAYPEPEGSQHVNGPPTPSASTPDPRAMRHELEVARSAPAASPSSPVVNPTEPRGLRREREMLDFGPQRSRAVSAPGMPLAQQWAEAARRSGLLHDALAELRQELEARTESERRLTDTATTLRRELQARSAAEEKVREQLATAQGRLEARTARQALLETTIAELRAEVSELQAADHREANAQTEAKSRSDALADQLSRLQAQLAELRPQVSELARAREKAEAEVHGLHAEIATLRQELSAAQESASFSASALKEAERLLGEANQLAADAEARLAVEHSRAQQAEHSREQIEREFAQYRARSARVHGAIEELRRQLETLRTTQASIAATPSAAPPGGPQPSAAPEPVPAEAPGPPTAAYAAAEDTAPEVQPQRLADALARLREATPAAEEPPVEAPEPTAEAPPPEPTAQRTEPTAEAPPPGRNTEPPEPQQAQAAPPPEARRDVSKPTKRWLRPLLKALANDDPVAAGRLVIELLPAQRLRSPRAFAYDLVLDDRDCVRVTFSDGLQIERTSAPRPTTDVDFSVTGDLASLARLLTAGWLRRRFGRDVAKIGGDRGASAALRALGRAEITLGDLHAAGVRLDAPLTLKVVALMIPRKWTAGERFTLAHEEAGASTGATYLHVRDGQPLAVTDEAPLGPVATTIICSAESLLPLLAGERPPDVIVRGEDRPLPLLQRWIIRAQSG